MVSDIPVTSEATSRFARYWCHRVSEVIAVGKREVWQSYRDMDDYRMSRYSLSEYTHEDEHHITRWGEKSLCVNRVNM